MRYLDPINPMQDAATDRDARDDLVKLLGESAKWLLDSIEKARAEAYRLHMSPSPAPGDTDPAVWDAEAARQHRLAQLADDIARWQRELAAMLGSLTLSDANQARARDAWVAELESEDAKASAHSTARRESAKSAERKASDLKVQPAPATPTPATTPRPAPTTSGGGLPWVPPWTGPILGPVLYDPRGPMGPWTQPAPGPTAPTAPPPAPTEPPYAGPLPHLGPYTAEEEAELERRRRAR